MRIIILSIILSFPFYDTYCQQQTNKFDTIGFINTAIKDKRSHIYLFTDLHDYTISEIKQRVEKGKFVKRVEDENGNDISDSIVLSKVELRQLLNQLKFYKSYQWSEQNTSGIHLDRLKLLGRDTATGVFDYAIKYQILPPLLFRNGQYCLFYYDYHCGPLCGHGRLAVYKKENNNEWKYWWTLILWDE